MMFGLPFGLVVEGSVAVLLALTIGYCAVLNMRLKRLHADRATLQQMIGDLVHATKLANLAIQELKTTAVETDLSLAARMEEAERFGIELANHVNSGQGVVERIKRIAQAVRQNQPIEQAEDAGKARAAIEKLNSHQRSRGLAA